jgi:4-hydroxy-tetrahydrodipicolinate synthase
MNGPLFGIVVATVTPFDADGGIDFPSWSDLLSHLADAGVHGVLACGTTGEGMFLSPEERAGLTEVAVEVLRPRGVRTAVQVGALTTEESIHTARLCAGAAPDALAVVTPMYYRYPQGSIDRHFAFVLDAVPKTPVYLYNLPGSTGNSFPPDLVLGLRERYPNLAGVKDSSKDFDVTDSFVAAGIDTLCGTDSQMAPALLAGAVGAVSAVGNCEPEAVMRLWHAFENHHLDKLRAAHREVVTARAVLKTGPPILPYKEALVKRAIIATATTRLPL